MNVRSNTALSHSSLLLNTEKTQQPWKKRIYYHFYIRSFFFLSYFVHFLSLVLFHGTLLNGPSHVIFMLITHIPSVCFTNDSSANSVQTITHLYSAKNMSKLNASINMNWGKLVIGSIQYSNGRGHLVAVSVVLSRNVDVTCKHKKCIRNSSWISWSTMNGLIAEQVQLARQRYRYYSNNGTICALI